jgi:hypothetical protein
MYGLPLFLLPMKAKELAFCAMLTALGVVLLFVSYLFPSMDLTMGAGASLCLVIILYRYSLRSGLLAFVAIGILSFFFAPLSACVAFVFFFGPFPILRTALNHFQKVGVPKTRRILLLLGRYLAANIIGVGGYFLFAALFTDSIPWFIFLPFFNVVLILYDHIMIRLWRIVQRRWNTLL